MPGPLPFDEEEEPEDAGRVAIVEGKLVFTPKPGLDRKKAKLLQESVAALNELKRAGRAVIARTGEVTLKPQIR